MAARAWWAHPVVAGVVGVFAGIMTIVIVEAAGHRLLGSVDPTRPDTVPPAMYALVLAAWVAGAAVAAAVATSWAGRRTRVPGTVAGLVPFAGALLTVATVPHPVWAIVLAVALMPAAAVLVPRALVAGAPRA